MKRELFERTTIMTQNTPPLSIARGQRLDLHVTTLRNEAEDLYGSAFAETAALGNKLDDPAFPDDQFDAAVIGLLCSVVLRVRPLPAFLRQAVGILLQVVPGKRKELVTIPVHGHKSSVQAHSDRAMVDLVLDALKDNLYPPRSYAGPLTDIGCWLEGLRLTWRRDILSEADAQGIITIAGLKRIRAKLTEAVLGIRGSAGAILVDHNGKVTGSTNNGAGSAESERRIRLIEIIERAINIGSTVQIIPSRIREERISQAYQRAVVSKERRA